MVARVFKVWNVLVLMRMRKVGSVDWTVGKLLAIVLAVVLLVIVVFGWSVAIVPLYERGAGKVDEVLILLHIRDGGVDVECIERDGVLIDGVGVGDVRICRDGCEVVLDVEGNGLRFDNFYSKSFKYYVSAGVMRHGISTNEGKWYDFDQSYLGLDIEKIRAYREIYSEMNNTLLNDVFNGDSKKFESFMKFNPGNVLQFRHKVMGYQQTYSWNDGKWDWFGGRYSGVLDPHTLVVKWLWGDYYSSGVDIFFGSKMSGINEKIEGSLSRTDFIRLVNNLIEEWELSLDEYNENVEKIEKLSINVGGNYPLDVVEHELSGTSYTSRVSVDLGDGEDKVGIYFENGLRFYSEERGDDYDNIVRLFSDERWKDLIKVNKLYDFLKEDVCK